MKLSKKKALRIERKWKEWKNSKVMQSTSSYQEPRPAYNLQKNGSKSYKEDVVIKELSKKGININNKQIDMSRRRDCGNRSLGKIDFLVNHCNYRIVKI